MKRIRNECVRCRRFRPKVALQMTFTGLGLSWSSSVHLCICVLFWTDWLYSRDVEVPRDGESFHLPGVCGFAKTLSVDDFLMMLRRFVSIYRKPDHIQKTLYILLAYSFNINNNTITHKCSSSLLDLSDLRIFHLFTERSSQYFCKYSNFQNQIYNKFAS